MAAYTTHLFEFAEHPLEQTRGTGTGMDSGWGQKKSWRIVM